MAEASTASRRILDGLADAERASHCNHVWKDITDVEIATVKTCAVCGCRAWVFRGMDEQKSGG